MDCADFGSSFGAQQYLGFVSPPGDPNGLDADGDGLACEEVFSSPPTQAAQYDQPVLETPVVTTAAPVLPTTGGLPFVPMVGTSLRVLGVAGLAIRRCVS